MTDLNLYEPRLMGATTVSKEGVVYYGWVFLNMYLPNSLFNTNLLYADFANHTIKLKLSESMSWG